MASKTVTGVLLNEEVEISLHDVCLACSTTTEWVVELVEEGVIEPIDYAESDWRFAGPSLVRARAAIRLQRDLDINLAGVALALDLMEEMESIRERLRRLETDTEI